MRCILTDETGRERRRGRGVKEYVDSKVCVWYYDHKCARIQLWSPDICQDYWKGERMACFIIMVGHLWIEWCHGLYT